MIKPRTARLSGQAHYAVIKYHFCAMVMIVKICLLEKNYNAFVIVYHVTQGLMQSLFDYQEHRH